MPRMVREWRRQSIQAIAHQLHVSTHRHEDVCEKNEQSANWESHGGWKESEGAVVEIEAEIDGGRQEGPIGRRRHDLKIEKFDWLPFGTGTKNFDSRHLWNYQECLSFLVQFKKRQLRLNASWKKCRFSFGEYNLHRLQNQGSNPAVSSVRECGTRWGQNCSMESVSGSK